MGDSRRARRWMDRQVHNKEESLFRVIGEAHGYFNLNPLGTNLIFTVPGNEIYGSFCRGSLVRLTPGGRARYARLREDQASGDMVPVKVGDMGEVLPPYNPVSSIIGPPDSPAAGVVSSALPVL